MRAGSAASSLLLAVVLTATVSAHRLDEYLQSARVGVEPDRVDVELSLAPGLATADRIVSLIDRDRDGTASAAEKHAYAVSVIGAIAMRIDGKPLETQLIDAAFPALELLRRGDGGIRIRARAAVPPVPVGPHQLSFSHGHLPDVSVYLANALVPESDRVAVRAQRRDEAQRELIIEYVLHAEAPLDAARDQWSFAFVLLMGASAMAVGLFTGLRSRARRVEAVIL